MQKFNRAEVMVVEVAALWMLGGAMKLVKEEGMMSLFDFLSLKGTRNTGSRNKPRTHRGFMFTDNNADSDYSWSLPCYEN